MATEPAAVAKKGGVFLLLHSRVTKKGRPVYSSTEMLSCLSMVYRWILNERESGLYVVNVCG